MTDSFFIKYLDNHTVIYNYKTKLNTEKTQCTTTSILLKIVCHYYLLLYQDHTKYTTKAIANNHAKVPVNQLPNKNPINAPIVNKTPSAFLPDNIFLTILLCINK